MPPAALAHLKTDPILAVLIDKYGPLNYPRSTELFASIASSIVSQQLSVKAAATIWSRLLLLFPGGVVTPQPLLELDPQAIRVTGVSFPKVSYLKDLATKTLDGTLQLDRLDELSDEDIIAHLVAVKGVGRWTAEMLLMFDLQRPDILPLDDIGIQNAFGNLYGLNRKHKSLPKKMLKIAERWRPYRTFACWYLWKSLDNSPKPSDQI